MQNMTSCWPGKSGNNLDGMRRILRKVAEGETQALGDTTTLLDPQVVDEIVAGRK